MKLNLKTIKYYFLTTGKNDLRKNHIMDIFKDFDLTEVNPILDIPKQQSGAIGYSRMIDAGIRNQNPDEPFQPFGMLEDDVSICNDFSEDLEIPKNADLLYIGISPWAILPKDNFCNGNSQNNIYEDVDDNIFRIYNMLSTHGVIVCSSLGALTLQKSTMECYYIDYVWDNIIAKTLPFINAYALKIPLVYQDGAYGGNNTTNTTFGSIGKIPFNNQFKDLDSSCLSIKMMKL